MEIACNESLTPLDDLIYILWPRIVFMPWFKHVNWNFSPINLACVANNSDYTSEIHSLGIKICPNESMAGVFKNIWRLFLFSLSLPPFPPIFFYKNSTSEPCLSSSTRVRALLTFLCWKENASAGSRERTEFNGILRAFCNSYPSVDEGRCLHTRQGRQMKGTHHHPHALCVGHLEPGAQTSMGLLVAPGDLLHMVFFPLAIYFLFPQDSETRGYAPGVYWKQN